MLVINPSLIVIEPFIVAPISITYSPSATALVPSAVL